MTAKVKEWILYAAWLCLYILCVGLGTVEEVDGSAKVFFVLTALIFFIPGIILLVLGKKQQNKKMVLERIKPLDEVAYIRFASVYRRFQDVQSFINEIKTMK